ncbi:MAG: hypothetical protein AAFY20_11695 [Cyanobacteria bacterium J06639_14]
MRKVVPSMFRIQINADTEQEVEAFMTTISAEDVVIEEWDYTLRETGKTETIVHGFGMSPCLPKYLNRLADVMEISLIYAEPVIQEEYQCFLSEQASNTNREEC